MRSKQPGDMWLGGGQETQSVREHVGRGGASKDQSARPPISVCPVSARLAYAALPLPPFYNQPPHTKPCPHTPDRQCSRPSRGTGRRHRAEGWGRGIVPDRGGGGAAGGEEFTSGLKQRGGAQ